MKETVTHHLAEVKVKARCTYERLTVFPLIAPGAAGPDYRTLDEALAAGTVSVSEVSDAGTVPVIRFSNTGDLPVLLVTGGPGVVRGEFRGRGPGGRRRPASRGVPGSTGARRRPVGLRHGREALAEVLFENRRGGGSDLVPEPVR